MLFNFMPHSSFSTVMAVHMRALRLVDRLLGAA